MPCLADETACRITLRKIDCGTISEAKYSLPLRFVRVLFATPLLTTVMTLSVISEEDEGGFPKAETDAPESLFLAI